MRQRLQCGLERQYLLFNKSINIVCINCDSVIDKNLRINDVEFLEYPRNTNNERKIIADLSKLGKIDMIIFNTVKTFTNVIKHFNPKYVALINKKNEYIDGYDFYNNIYIKFEKKDDN